MMLKYIRLGGLVKEASVRNLTLLYQCHPNLPSWYAALSSSSDLGFELEKFALNLKHKLKQQKAQKPPEDIPALYDEARGQVKGRQRRPASERDTNEGRLIQEKPPPKGALDLGLDFSSLDVGKGAVEKKLEDIDSLSEKYSSAQEHQDGDEEEEGEEEEEEVEGDVASRFKRQSSEELMRRIKHISEGRVVRLPMTPAGPKMRIRAQPDSVPTTYIPWEKLHPKFKETCMGEYLISIGCVGDKFERICERNPKGFHNDVQELQACIKVAQNFMKLSEDDVAHLICSVPKLLTYSSKDVEERIRYIRKALRLDKVELKHVIYGCPDCLHEDFAGEFVSAVSFLNDELGIKMNQIRGWALDFPMFISVATKEKLESVLGFFKRKLEFKSSHLINALKREPRLVAGDISRYLKIKNWIVKYGLSNDDGKAMLRENPEVLLYDLDEMIRRTLDWFHVLGYKRPHILKIIMKKPQVLACDIDLYKQNAAKLRSLRFSPEEIRIMIFRAPSILEADLNSLEVKQKIRYMTHALGKSIKDLVSFPEYFICSFEDRIITRVEFLRHLGRLDSLAWPLKKLYSDNDQTFCINHAHKPYDRYKAFLDDWQKNKAAVIGKWTSDERDLKEELLAA